MKKIIYKTIKTLFALGIIFAVALLAVNLYVISKSQKMTYSPENINALPTDADCIIVLGAGLKKDGTPNHMLRDRLDLAIALYCEGVCEKLLLTGDHGSEHYDEVNAMKDYALSKGVDPSHIYLDHAGFSTYDSMYRAKEIFRVEKAVVITQKYHLYRALYISDALGIDSYGVNSDPFTYVGQAYRDVREVLARFKDFFSVAFGMKPEYLGKEIDIKVAAAAETFG